MSNRKSVNAIPVKAVTGAKSQDGSQGVLFLVRDQPDLSGRDRLNISLKAELLPAVAAVCLGLMDPRRSGQGGRKSRALTPTRQVEVGLASSGQVALTFRLEAGASISFGLDPNQARDLGEALVEFAQWAGASPTATMTGGPALPHLTVMGR